MKIIACVRSPTCKSELQNPKMYKYNSGVCDKLPPLSPLLEELAGDDYAKTRKLIENIRETLSKLAGLEHIRARSRLSQYILGDTAFFARIAL